VSDQVNEPLITDEELAEAIFAKVRDGVSGFAVVQRAGSVNAARTAGIY
jgi:hypothetical protein